jgi:hypothetical protein
MADGALNLTLKGCPFTARAVAVEPGVQQRIGPVVTLDEGGTDMPPEHRRAVVATAGTAAAHLPAVLPETPPQCCFARGGQRVGAYPHHPKAAVGADLTVFEEEVDAKARPAILGGGVNEPA